jgi:serine/threonine-protein kinase RsbW
MDTIRLSVPATLLYRDVVVRVVASVCRLIGNEAAVKQESNQRNHVEDFDAKVISAVGEAFNNVAIHAYTETRGDAKLELEFERDRLTVRMMDTGGGFNLSAELVQDRETLRESYMGLEIIFACMDEVTYVRGSPTTPNVLIMTKRYVADAVGSNRAARPALVRA